MNSNQYNPYLPQQSPYNLIAHPEYFLMQVEQLLINHFYSRPYQNQPSYSKKLILLKLSCICVRVGMPGCL
jgi:hypothetical protein